jgi:hypothetical protein
LVSSSGCAGALDAERKTASGRTVYLKVVDVCPREEAIDYGLEPAVRNVFLREQAPAARISFDSPRAPAKLFRKTRVFGVALAALGVNVDRTGLR